MGLDMYLEADYYVSEYSDKALLAKLQQIVPPGPGTGRVKGVTVEVAYWRKANAIHQWFVEHCAGGAMENCARVAVDRAQLMALMSACNAVVQDHAKAPEVLPTQGGFFFGGVEYDQYYFSEVQDTRTMLMGLKLTEEQDHGWDFYYTANW